MDSNGTIGIFDSGVGGLTIWKEIVQTLPNESTIYISDSAHAPYGTKSSTEIIDLSISHTQELIDRGAKIIVVACNTATTQAIETLRNKFKIPFIGIEPAIKPAAISSLTRSIAVLATHGTLESEHFNTAKDNFTQDVEVVTRVGEGLVSSIENGELNSTKLQDLLTNHLNNLITPNTDRLVLGCTHYPLLISMIKNVIGDDIVIVDSGKPVAEQTKRVLESEGLLKTSNAKGVHTLYTTKNVSLLKDIVKEIGMDTLSSISYFSLYQSE